MYRDTAGDLSLGEGLGLIQVQGQPSIPTLILTLLLELPPPPPPLGSPLGTPPGTLLAARLQ